MGHTASSARPVTRTVPAADGELIQVQVLGSGTPLVFLHGWTSSHREWLGCAEALADQHTCYCWDARGHGGHRLRTATPVTVQRMAQDLWDVISGLALERPVLLGHSMGALTIWELVRQFGCAKLSKLCLVDQSPRLLTDEHWTHGIYGDFTESDNDAFIARLEADFADAVLRLVGEGNNPHARQAYARHAPGLRKVGEYLRTLQPEPLIEVWRSLALADFRDVLPQIDVPTLLVHGDESHFYSLELAQYMRDRIPDAVLHVYEGTDHSPHLWQRERFIADLRAFTAT